MGNAFIAALPAGWQWSRGGWTVFDLSQCWAGSNCYGSNPSSPYGYPTFPDSTGIPNGELQLNPNEAVVIFLRTPPRVRYFGFTQSLYARQGQTIFGSMSDTLNKLKFATTSASNIPGMREVSQYGVIVWTADMNALRSIQRSLHKQDIPAAKVNFIPIPINLPLFMGYGSQYDTFNLIMRTALPSVQANLDSYNQEMPFYVVKVGPSTPTPVTPAPTIGYDSEISGVAEDQSYQAGLDGLVVDVRTNLGSAYFLKSSVVTNSAALGLDCIQYPTQYACSGDNHDALYSGDMPRPLTVQHLNDLVIIMGVNHRKTGQAIYVNHTVTDPSHAAGIVSVDDPALTTASALYWAGITDPNDPRAQTYANLYAYAVSYDCTGLQYCLQIPAITPTYPYGLAPGAPFQLVTRAYLNPVTKVRPSTQEIFTHKVLLATHK